MRETLYELFLGRNISRNSGSCKIIKTVCSFEINLKCFPSSKHEPHSFAKLFAKLTDRKKISGKTLAIF